MKIGIDLDGVIADWCPGFLKFYNRVYRKNSLVEDIRKYNIWECGIGLDENGAWRVMGEFYNSDLFDEIPLISGAKDALVYLGKQNDLSIITSRSLTSKPKTELFLEKHFSDVNLRVFYSADFRDSCSVKGDNDTKEFHTTSGVLKSEICRSLGINYFIEDCVEYAVDCASTCNRVFLFNQPWNLNESLNGNGNILRVKNWEDILDYIKKLEKENKKQVEKNANKR